MTYSEHDVIEAVRAFTPLSVQSREESEAGENRTAKLLYNSSSRTQGNFSLYLLEAELRLKQDLARYGVSLTDRQTAVALAYLIWDLAIKKFPEWDAKTVSLGESESVTRNTPGRTSAFSAYIDLLRSQKRRGGYTNTIGDVDDFTNYPASMHPAPLGSVRLSGYDR
jgi:hypothetical protein